MRLCVGATCFKCLVDKAVVGDWIALMGVVRRKGKTARSFDAVL